MDNQPDLQALALTKAIRQKESGGNYQATGDNGTSTGAYQFQGPTWSLYAKEILNDPNAPMTPENQNAVTYGKIKKWKDSGMGPAEIAAAWNAGEGSVHDGSWTQKVGATYNTPQYVNDVVNNFHSIYPQEVAKFGNQNQIQIPQSNQPSVGGFLGNVVDSGTKILGGLGNAIMHPIQTVENLASTGAGAIESGLNLTGLTHINNQDTQNFSNLVDTYKQKYGGNSVGEVINNIGHTLYTDPVGAALDLSVVLDGAGAILGKVGKIADVAKASELAKASDFISTAQGLVKANTPEAIQALTQEGMISKLADTVNTIASYTNPLTPVIKGASKLAKGAINVGGKLAKTAVSQFTGMNPETISTIVSNPAEFTKVAQDAVSRGSLLDQVQSGLSKLEGSYAETGQLYQGILKGTNKVTLPENFIQDILQKGALDETGNAIKFGFKLEPKDGGGFKVVADTNSFTRNPADIKAIQTFVDNWGDKTDLTPREFLAMRKDANEMAHYGRDVGKNQAADYVGKAVQAELNKSTRPQIAGLKEADTAAQPQITLIRKVTKDLYNADGSLKDSAANKVANALNKEGLMQRLETISPGIGQKLEVLKAVEDIEKSAGIKVGTYLKSGVSFGALTGNLPMIIGLIISHPTLATKILQGFGYTGKAILPITTRIRAMIGALPPEILNQYLKLGTVVNQTKP